MSSELKNSGIRVAVGDCSVTEHRQWLIKLAKLYVHAKHYKHNQDRRMAQGLCGNGLYG